MLTENPILWYPGEQVKIADDVQAAKGAMVFGQQVIDKTFGSRGVDVLHDVRAGKSASVPLRSQVTSPLSESWRRLSSPQRRPALYMGAWFRQAHSCLLALCSHMLFEKRSLF